jgi:hypothetical protein
MTFVHHNTGEWERFNADTAATRTHAFVHEYPSLDAISNEWLRNTFKWMLDNGMSVTQCGSDTFQIRGQA